MIKPFRVLFPASPAEAAAMLAEHGERARLYAGGAELLVLLRYGIVEADYLVDVKRLPGISDLDWGDDRLRIGAAVTHHRLEVDDAVARRLPMLRAAESQIGNIRIRNQGTLGGNVCFNDPHSDPGPPLLVYEAEVIVEGARGRRQMALEDFAGESYETALEPAEVLTAVEVRPLPPGWGESYQRLERFHRPTLNVAVAARREKGTLAETRIAVGSVAPRALRLRRLEQELGGVPIDSLDARIDAAAPALAGVLRPAGDLLGSAAYKLHVTTALLKRALREALGS